MRPKLNKTRRAKKQRAGGSLHCYTRTQPCPDAPILTREQTATQPHITLPSSIQYPAVLVMFDNDVPPASKPGYLHWLRVYNAPNEYTDIVPYAPPTPPPESGRKNSQGIWFHEYIFQLYSQVKTPIPQVSQRPAFNITNFKKKLAITSAPIAEDNFRVNA